MSKLRDGEPFGSNRDKDNTQQSKKQIRRHWTRLPSTSMSSANEYSSVKCVKKFVFLLDQRLPDRMSQNFDNLLVVIFIFFLKHRLCGHCEFGYQALRNDCSLVYGLRCQIHLVFCCVVDKAVLSFARPTELRDGEPFGSSCTPRSSLSKVGPTYSQRLNTRGHEQQSIQYCTRSRLSSCGSSIGTLCSSRAIEGATGGKCWCQVSLTMQHAPMSHDLCIATDEIINETIHCVDISRPNDDVTCSQVTGR